MLQHPMLYVCVWVSVVMYGMFSLERYYTRFHGGVWVESDLVVNVDVILLLIVLMGLKVRRFKEEIPSTDIFNRQRIHTFVGFSILFIISMHIFRGWELIVISTVLFTLTFWMYFILVKEIERLNGERMRILYAELEKSKKKKKVAGK